MKIYLLYFLMALVFQIQNVLAQGPEVCQREAVVYCDYYQAFQGPEANEASEKEFCRALKAKLTQLFTRDRFIIIEEGPLDASNMPENEYQFEVKFEAVTNYTKNGPNPKMTLVLKFDRGSYWDPVQWWDVEDPGDTSDMNNWQPLLIKLEQSIRNGPDILQIIDKYEKRPVNLQIGMDKEVLDPGEKIDIHVFDFKDERGNDSEPFNRIVVHVESGEIINGAVTDIGPDYYAFLADRGMFTLKYQAPDNCDNLKEKITVYNSCDVLPEQRYFMHRTLLKDQLEEKEFDINCFDAKINIRKTYDKTLTTSYRDLVNKTVENHDLAESIEASATLYLTLSETMDMPVFNQTWQYFTPKTVTITSFNNDYKENRHMSGPNYETNVDITRITKTYKLEGKEYITQFPPWMLVIDNETQKAVKLIPAGYGIEFEVNETEQINSVQGNEKKSQTTTKTSSKLFKLGPVGEEVPDPTIKTSDTWIQDYLKNQGVELPAGVPIPKISNQETVKEIHPDILVTSGDGLTSFGGRGENTIETEVENGVQEEKMNYTWQMTRKKPSQ